MNISRRLPDKSNLLQVFGLIVLLIYGWSVYQFFWNLPSWLKLLTLGEIGVVLAYTLVTNLVESLLILGGLIMVSVILPTKWLRDDFIVRGGASALYFLIFIMVIARSSTPYDQLVSKYAIRGVIDFTFLQLVIGEAGMLRKLISTLADRSTIFLYLYIPASVLSIVVVLIRSIRGM